MPDARGRFLPGEHWRPEQPFRDREWLLEHYVWLGESAGDIAAQFGVTGAAVMHWLRRHGIPRRTVSEARALKSWGLTGSTNGMAGRTGAENPNWRGGVSAERQGFYSSREWSSAVREVWARDRGVCQRCGLEAPSHPKGSGRSWRTGFHLHHIVPFSVVALRADPSNLILLCPACHGWVHSRANVDGAFIASVGGKEVGG